MPNPQDDNVLSIRPQKTIPRGRPTVSFEFFPPKNPEMEAKLWDCVTKLQGLSPEFVSVTYGAGGSTRERTHNTVKRILNETALKPAAHLTCVGASREEVKSIAQAYWDSGVRHIVALRGDPADNSGVYTPHPQGYAYASDLVEGLKQVADFEISVAAYPETHPEALSSRADIDNLKRKIDAGATRAITQYFFDISHYLRFRDALEKEKVTIPIVPGILPVGNYAQTVRFSEMCGTSIPDWMRFMFDGLDNDPGTRNLVAITLASEQCRLLRAEGVSHFHFYTLNRADLVSEVCKTMGIFTF